MLAFNLIPKPDRKKRIIWDQFHSLKFPESSFVPRDSLSNFDYPFDWHGDHPFTNFIQLFQFLSNKGYYLEILRGTFECFNAENYGTLILVDPEEKFSLNEINKLEKDIMMNGLSLIIFAEWYDEKLLELSSFTSKSGKKTKPITGYKNLKI